VSGSSVASVERGAVPAAEALTRAALERAPKRVLKPGGPTKADVSVAELGGVEVVVKDFAHKAWWVRWIGRLQIDRECGAYGWLGPTSGVPRLVGRIDRHALALEHIAGRQIAFCQDRFTRGPALFPRLQEVLRGIHAKGLVHFDLRGSENVLVTEDDALYVIDFAGAVWMRPGGLAHRLFFRRLRRVDESALLKWKGLLNAGPYTAEEQRFLRRYGFWRSLWPFNRKRKKP